MTTNKSIYWMPTKYGTAFFDDKGKPLAAWHENDDRYTEYLGGLLSALGFTVQRVPTENVAEYTKKIKRRFQGIA